MKQLICTLILSFGIMSCNNTTTENLIEKKSNDTTRTVSSNNEQKTNIYIKDKSQYDSLFITGLAAYNEPIELIDNYLVTGTDTTYFPDDIPLNKKTVFKGAANNQSFTLIVTRTNQTNLEYSFLLTDKNNKPIDSKLGKAILGSNFFLACESDEDTQTGSGYGSFEYWDRANNCWFSIRIGIGLDANGKRRYANLWLRR